MSTRYKIQDQHATYFLTLTVVGWIDVFARKECRDIVIDSLQFCQKNKGLTLNAYVIMSNHLHLIASAQPPQELSNILRDFKKYTATQMRQFITFSPKESRKEWLLPLLKRYANRTAGKKDFTLWQADNHPIEFYSPSVTAQKLAYLHNNPVNAAWVERAEHYLYSSDTNYYLGHGLLAVDVIEPNSEIGFVRME